MSIVAPCFNEDETIGEFHRRARAAAVAVVAKGCESVLVEDGSSGRAWQVRWELTDGGRGGGGGRVGREFGQQRAGVAGLRGGGRRCRTPPPS